MDVYVRQRRARDEVAFVVRKGGVGGRREYIIHVYYMYKCIYHNIYASMGRDLHMENAYGHSYIDT